MTMEAAPQAAASAMNSAADDMAALRAEILAKVDAAIIATQDSQAIADALSIGRTQVATEPTRVGKGQVLATLGMDEGNSFLDVICSNDPVSPFRHAKDVLAAGEMDLTMPLVRGMIAALAPAHLTQDAADALLALGEEPAPVSEFMVRRACWSDLGEWLL